MLGYFILKEEAEKLGIVNNPEIKKSLQQTYFVVTDKDVELGQDRTNLDIFDNISNILNKNYFDSMAELIVHLTKTNSQ